MAKFDSNQWYHIYLSSNNDSALVGTSLYEGKKGATFFNNSDLTKPEQKWQFYAIDSSNYMIRSKDGGPKGYMAAQYDPNTKETLVTMFRIDLADDTTSWTITPSKSNAYYFSNRANGTSWRFGTEGTKTIMDNNITDRNPSQELSFEPIEVIDDEKFSTVDLLSKIISSPATSATFFTTPSTPPASSSTNTAAPSDTLSTPGADSSSGGSSTPAKAAIGASIGGVALIALVVLGLFLWRRRKPLQTSYHQTNQEAYKEDVPSRGHYMKAELAADDAGTVKYASHDTRPELAVDEGTAELPSTHATPADFTELPAEDVRNELPEER